jgi:hypothetical protein
VRLAAPAAAAPAGNGGNGGGGIPPELLEAKKILLTQLGGLGACIRARFTDSPGPDQVGVGNIHGVGIGQKLRDGYLTGEWAVQVVVARKVTDRNRIADEQANIPPYIVVGDKKVPTDVVAMEPFAAQTTSPAYSYPESPARAGTSISPAGKPTGTLGCLVWVNKGTADDPQVIACILSNAHVMALDDKANPLGPKGIDGGDGLPIVQPGAADPTAPSNIKTVGYLYNYSLLSLASSNNPAVIPSSFVDAAIAWTDSDFGLASFKHHTYELNADLDKAGNPYQMAVKKEGRTTGLTTGIIKSVAYDGVVGYGPGGGPPFAHYTDAYVIEGSGQLFSDHGDSGSLVVEASSNIPVALLLAGNGQQTFANPIGDVVKALNIRAFINSSNQSGPD